ncbi:mating alpha-pheromone PpgA [Aspergillus alliaceus]|uniref:Mating alpha-pheromone PpgA n=1 Tax=Petromyces alliaceus TaxID=209559 RepID=A0A5N7C761_PETAA|nr:mating alpha-pheromone PpgA [Aspergillus alliaceus]
MKLISVVIAALATTSVQAGALQRRCTGLAQGCYMLKRATDASEDVRRSAEALAEATPEAEGLAKWCHLPGQGCLKFKRAAEAVDEAKRSADALADAMVALDEEY